MVKLIRRIGFVAYATYLWKINLEVFKKIISFLLMIIFSVFFYSDLRELLREISPSYLIYALLLKWAIITFFSYLIFRYFLKINWELSVRKLIKLISGSDEIKPDLKEKLKELKDIKEIGDDLKKYRDMEKFPKLKSEIDGILDINRDKE
jgi:hypothetical protein